MLILFDRVNKIIEVEAPDTELTIQFLYNAICDFQDEQINMDLPRVAMAAGKDFLGGDLYVGVTLTLLDGWRVRFEPRLVPTICNVSGGNLVAQDELGQSIFPLAYSDNVLATLTQSSSATMTELSETSIQYAAFNGGVTIDVANGTDSVAYPAGTPLQPCKTLLNARDIAIQRGFKTIYVIGNITLVNVPGWSFDSYLFSGQGRVVSTITIANALFHNCSFKACYLLGVFADGSSFEVHESNIGTISNVCISAFDCELSGTIILKQGGDDCNFYNCTDGLPGPGTPAVNINNALAVGFWNYSGGLALSNVLLDSQISVNFASGRLILDNTCKNGDIIVRGVGTLQGSPDGTIVNSSGLVSPASVAAVVWSTLLPGVFIAGSAGNILSKVGTDSVLSAALQTKITEIYELMGLDPAIPLLVNKTKRVAGGINQTITGDANEVTVQRI